VDRVDRAEPVHARHALDLLGVHGRERAVIGDAGVRHDDVGVREPLERLSGLLAAADIGGHDLVARARQLGRERSQLILRARAEPDDAPAARELVRERAPDAPRGASYEDARSGLELHRAAS
jgi:hypothetical protein